VEENLESTSVSAEDKLVLSKLKEYGQALEKRIFS